jgi:hypothetical protein
LANLFQNALARTDGDDDRRDFLDRGRIVAERRSVKDKAPAGLA